MELLGSYSNQTDVLSKITTLLELKPNKTGRDQVKRASKQKQARLTRNQTQELIQRYQNGETVYQLGAAFSINRKSVSEILKRNGVTTRWRALTDGQIDEAIELYQSGLSLVAVGQQLDVTAGTVRRNLEQRGIARRTVGTNQWTVNVENEQRAGRTTAIGAHDRARDTT